MTRHGVRFALFCSVLLQTACSPAPEPIALPALPQLERLDLPVGQQFESAHRQAVRAVGMGHRLEIAEAAGRLGMLFHAYDYAEPALQSYQIARDQQPTDSRWQYLYGVVAMQLGQYEDASSALLQAHRLGANTSVIELRLGDVFLEQGELELAGEWFDRASVDPLVESRALAGLGLTQLEADRPEDAIPYLNRALAADPQNATAMHALGNAYRATGELAQGQRYLRQAQRFAARDFGDASGDPFMADVVDLRRGHKHFDALAVQALAEGNPELAIEYYRNALAASPEALDVRHNLAILLWRRGLRAQAQVEFDAIFESRPDYVTSHLFLGYELAVVGDLALAEQHIRAATAADPLNSRAAALLADFLGFNDRHQEALVAYRNLLELDPDTEKAWAGVVYSLVELGQFDEAIAVIDAGLRRLPDNRALLMIRRELRETNNDKSEGQ